MTADAGLASDSSETDFRPAAVLGSGSGHHLCVCVFLCFCVCSCMYLYMDVGPRRAVGERLDDILANKFIYRADLDHGRVSLAGWLNVVDGRDRGHGQGNEGQRP